MRGLFYLQVEKGIFYHIPLYHIQAMHGGRNRRMAGPVVPIVRKQRTGSGFGL